MNTPQRQRGSMAITMAVLLIGLISMLGLVEVGYLYWARRNVQKVADLASLSGAQRLNTCSTDNSDNSSARHNAINGNHFSGTLAITCGYWAPSITGKEHFTQATTEHPRNAVRVEATMPATPFIGFAHFTGVSATAIATHRGEPIAAFSVGSRLLGVDTDKSVLAPLLNGVLGTSLGLKLLSYEGVANSQLSLLGLKNALQIDAGTVDGVLDAQVTLGQFLDAVVQVLQQGPDSANIDLTLVNQQIADIKAQLGDTEIKLGDILNVNAGTSDPDTALDVDVNAADILNAALQAANSKHAAGLKIEGLKIPSLVDPNKNLANITLKLAIIEPPKIGIGRPGYNPDGTPRTVAHTAQIRLKIDVQALQAFGKDQTLLSLSSIPLVSDLLNLIVTLPNGTLSNIPLNLELVPAEAWLDDMQCHARNTKTGTINNNATIAVEPGALNLFLGNLPNGSYDNESKRWKDLVDTAITDGSAYTNMLDLALKVTLIHMDIISGRIRLKAYASTPIVRTGDTDYGGGLPLHFYIDPSVPVAKQANMTQSIDTGQKLLSTVLTSIFTTEALHAKLQTTGPGLIGLVGPLVDAIVNSITPLITSLLVILNPILKLVFGPLDTALIGPLLHLLGINIGAADVHLTSVNCNTGVQLVY